MNFFYCQKFVQFVFWCNERKYYEKIYYYNFVLCCCTGYWCWFTLCNSNPTYCIFRHHDNNKWFALIGTVPRSILKLSGDGDVDIINLKTNDAEFFRGVKGVLPAYHMNKNHWITVLLDGTIPLKNIQNLIEMSYKLT